MTTSTTTSSGSPASAAVSDANAQLSAGFSQAQSNVANADTSGEFNPLSPGKSGSGGEFEGQGVFRTLGKEENDETEEKEVAPQAKQETAAHKATTAAEADEEEELENDRISRSLSKLAKRDAALREKERGLAEQEKKLEKLFQFAQELEEDPAGAIAKLGLDADKLYATEFEKKQMAELTKVEKLEQRLEQLTQELKQKEVHAEISAKGQQWESDFSTNFEKDEYQMVRAWDPTGGIVRKLVADRYKETGKLMSPWKALGLLQAQIAEKVSSLTPGQAKAQQQDSRQKSKQLDVSKETKTTGAVFVEGEFDPEVVTKRSATSRVGRTVPAGVGSSPARASRELLSDDEDMDRISRKFEALLRSQR